MFGTLLKGIVFLAVSGFCAFGAIYLNGMPGSFTLRFNGSELRVSALAAICLVVLAFVFLFTAIFTLKKHLRMSSVKLVFTLIVAQILLGVLTVINFVPLDLALLHQITAALVISNLLFVLHSLIYSKS